MHKLATCGFVVIDVDTFELQVRVAVVRPSWVDAVLIGDHLPELCQYNSNYFFLYIISLSHSQTRKKLANKMSRKLHKHQFLYASITMCH